MSKEIVFNILGEGGGIYISRKKTKTGIVFLYHHNELDFTDEGLEVNEKREYSDFEKPFQLINDKYPWYMLYINIIHEDFRQYVIDKLIENINKNSIEPDYLDYSKSQLEDSLRISLSFIKDQGKTIWSYTERHGP
ncbi:MAG: hypothetical protein JJU28_07735 [Cyclobacteriaceae bacterium]|nr:hypothetical protein [Cyclobacteriaceae bacterium]